MLVSDDGKNIVHCCLIALSEAAETGTFLQAVLQQLCLDASLDATSTDKCWQKLHPRCRVESHALTPS